MTAPAPGTPLDIAFYAPLKAPSHPVPSGDRLMARLLIAAMERAGHRVALASDLRARLGDPEDRVGWAAVRQAAKAEVARIGASWQEGAPDLWVSYHPYYKSPDLIGPPLCAQFDVPMVTVEASYSARRNIGIWAEMQAAAMAGVTMAALNLNLTARDAAGLAAAAPSVRLARLVPFIDPTGFLAPAAPEPGHLVAVAMMRAGDKMESYARLAAALALVPGDWRLSVVGDGAMRAVVEALFAGLPAGRVRFLGQLAASDIAVLLERAAVCVWPGYGEAYGLSYLEAQAAGVPVVACRTAGVPEVVADGETGLLVPPDDDAAFAAAIARLLGDDVLRARLGAAARRHVLATHSIDAVAGRLDGLLRSAVAAGMP